VVMCSPPRIRRPTGNVESDLTIVADPPGPTLGAALTIPTSGVGVFFALGSDSNGTTTPPTCTWTGWITNVRRLPLLFKPIMVQWCRDMRRSFIYRWRRHTDCCERDRGVRLLGNGRRHAGGGVSTMTLNGSNQHAY
jgi:hypothetical protein